MTCCFTNVYHGLFGCGAACCVHCYDSLSCTNLGLSPPSNITYMPILLCVYGCADSIADTNIATSVAQDPESPPPTRTDDEILPFSEWLTVGKSNCYIDADKTQSNPTHKIAVDILWNTTFFRAFTVSSSIPSIYIQQFWNTMSYDKDNAFYRCQLDEQWVEITKKTLRNALQITQSRADNPFTSPPNPETLFKLVNDLGYPKEVTTISSIATNEMFQPWRVLLTLINMCLTGKTSGYERPRAPVLQILWGIVKGRNIDFAERIWEEFTFSINSFLKDKMKLSVQPPSKKTRIKLLIPCMRFTKMIILYLQQVHNLHPRNGSPLHLASDENNLGNLKFVAKGTDQEIFGMDVPESLISSSIREAPYFQTYLEKVAKYHKHLADEQHTAAESPTSKTTKQSKSKNEKKRLTKERLSIAPRSPKRAM